MNIIETLNRWEAIRRILGHEATTEPDDIDNIVFDAIGPAAMNLGDHQTLDGGALFTILMDYGSLISDIVNTTDRGIKPTMPAVDIFNLRIRHETCTGNTTFDVDATRGDITMTRRETLDPTSPRDIALWAASSRANRFDINAEVFATQPKIDRRTGRVSRFQSIHVLEAYAILASAGLHDATIVAAFAAKGIEVDPAKAWQTINDRAVGLALMGRDWCRRAAGVDLPDWAVQARAAQSAATQSLTLTPDRPVVAPADWDMDLMAE